MSEDVRMYRLKYRKTYVMLDVNPRKGICVACGKSVHKGEIKITNIHHYKYKYMTKTVKKDPLLALENTLELCYRCHQIADALRVLNDNKDKQIVKVLLIHPPSFSVKIRVVQALYIES